MDWERSHSLDDGTFGSRQANAPGMQMKPLGQIYACEKSSAPAIFSIAQNGRADGGAVGPQLMGAASNGHERKPCRTSTRMVHDAVVGDSALALHVRAHALPLPA